MPLTSQIKTRVPREMRRQFRKLAKLRGVPVAQIVREALKHYLKGRT